MPINDPFVSGRHCSITDNGDGTFTLEDLGSTNGTFVNGVQIIKTTVKPETVIQLGPNYRLPVKNLLPKLPPPPAQEFSLRPLKAVWDEYEQRLQALNNENARKVAIQRIPSFLSPLGMLVLFLDMPQGVRIAIISLSVLIGVLSFIWSLDTSKALPAKIRNLNQEFMNRYKCPNPKCGKPFPLQHYNMIEFTQGCPACKCKYTH